MTALEVILLISGVICVVVSFLVGTKEHQPEGRQVSFQAEMTDSHKEQIRKHINDVLENQVNEIVEHTEAQLDKISNIKILEMNEYAENIMGEINRNHNETVFLYDMLNEKAKEVKNTVKDINVAKKQVEEMKLGAETDNEYQQTVLQETVKSAQATRDMAKERLVELVRRSNERSRTVEGSHARNLQAGELNDMVAQQTENSPVLKKEVRLAAKDFPTDRADKTDENTVLAGMPVKARIDKNVNHNERILSLYGSGRNLKQIAKELNLGVGEVKLVLDLYQSEKNKEQQ